MKRLSEGWIINGLIALHGGQPFTVYNSDDTTGTDENAQRVNLVGNPYAGITHKFYAATPTSSATEQWINPAAFVSPPNGTFGTMRRNSLYGPGYSDSDISRLKTTLITERISLQLRGEVFNAFNRNTFGPPNNTLEPVNKFNSR